MAIFKKKREPPRRFDMNRTIAYPAREYAESESHEEKVPKKKRRFGFKKALLLLFIIVLAPLLIIGIWDARNFSSASQKLFGSGNALGLLNNSQLKASDRGRVNLMMIGYSADDPGHGGATLTDSIMVVSLDKDSHTGYMLSIPRDLYVDIPGYGHAKINEAFQDGERDGFSESGYSPGGTGLLEKIINDNFGLPIHYNATVNYGAVRQIVDALGGITVDIKSPDPRGLYDPNFKPEEGGPLTLANGPQQLDGATALRLTRARGSTYGSYGFPRSDFNRTANQQQVFAAINDQLDWKLVLDPRINGKIFDAAADNIKTNVKLSEVLPLYRLLKSVPDSSLKPVGLGDVDGVNLLNSYQTRSGQSALIPAAGIDDYSRIRALIEQL